ncbi:hypothetical protein GE118_00740 [Mycoplasma sp. NEAQ87857]|uniref:FIVAR domain-containing protein n=1 Tax=Mycoplasma sp. NEAQ87857 TaxID=2683967 RepID=UPI0013199366|nr:FIVAR domain-containing protein [Mycoplasma sp. NEAQ87857]QGZ97328.1 hypothetical protein GE118_00740 [Mycoplasma sp. NEAQ87857]
MKKHLKRLLIVAPATIPLIGISTNGTSEVKQKSDYEYIDLTHNNNTRSNDTSPIPDKRAYANIINLTPFHWQMYKEWDADIDQKREYKLTNAKQDWSVTINNTMGKKLTNLADKDSGLITATRLKIEVEIPKDLPISFSDDDPIYFSVNSIYENWPDISGVSKWGGDHQNDNLKFTYNKASKKYIYDGASNFHDIPGRQNDGFIGATRGGNYINFGDDGVWDNSYPSYFPHGGRSWGRYWDTQGPGSYGHLDDPNREKYLRNDLRAQRNDRAKIRNIQQEDRGSNKKIVFDLDLAEDGNRKEYYKLARIQLKFKTKINDNYYSGSQPNNFIVARLINRDNPGETFSSSYDVKASSERVISVNYTKVADEISESQDQKELKNLIDDGLKPQFVYKVISGNKKIKYFNGDDTKIILNTNQIPLPFSKLAGKLEATSETKFSNVNLNKKYKVVSVLNSSNFTVDTPSINNNYHYIYTEVYKQYLDTKKKIIPNLIGERSDKEKLKSIYEEILDWIWKNKVDGNASDNNNVSTFLKYWNKLNPLASKIQEIENLTHLADNVKTEARKQLYDVNIESPDFGDLTTKVVYTWRDLDTKTSNLITTLIRYKDVLNTNNYLNATHKNNLDNEVSLLFGTSGVLSGAGISANSNLKDIKLSSLATIASNLETRKNNIEIYLSSLDGDKRLTAALARLDGILREINKFKTDNNPDGEILKKIDSLISKGTSSRSTNENNANKLNTTSDDLEKEFASIKLEFAKFAIEKFQRDKENSDLDTRDLNSKNNDLKSIRNPITNVNDTNDKVDKALKELLKAKGDDAEKSYDKALAEINKLKEANKNKTEYNDIITELTKAISNNPKPSKTNGEWTKENIEDLKSKTTKLKEAYKKALVDMLNKQKELANNIIVELNKNEYNKKDYNDIKRHLETSISNANTMNDSSSVTDIKDKLDKLEKENKKAAMDKAAADIKYKKIEDLKALITKVTEIKNKVNNNTTKYPSDKLSEITTELNNNSNNNYSNLDNSSIELKLNSLKEKANEFVNNLLDKQNGIIDGHLAETNPALDDSVKSMLNTLKSHATTTKSTSTDNIVNDLTTKDSALEVVAKGIEDALLKDEILKKIAEANTLKNNDDLVGDDKTALTNKITEVNNYVNTVTSSTDKNTLDTRKSNLETKLTEITNAVEKAKIDIAKEKLRKIIEKATADKDGITDPTLKRELETKINEATTAKNKSNAIETELNNAKDTLEKGLTVIKAKQAIKDAENARDDLTNKGVDLTELNKKKDALNSLITIDSPNNNSIDNAKDDLNKELELAKAIANAKDVINKINPTNPSTNTADSVTEENDLKNTLKSVDNAKKELETEIASSSKTKDTINSKTETLKNALETAKNKIVDEVNKLTNIDNDVKTNIINTIKDESTDLANKLKELEKAKSIDEAVKNLKTTIAEAKENKDSNVLTGTNLSDLENAITEANKSLTNDKADATKLIKANDDLNKVIIDTNVKEVEKEANKVIAELDGLGLTNESTELNNKLKELKEAAKNAKNLEGIKSELDNVKNLIDLDKSKIEAEKALNKVNNKTNINNDLSIKDQANHSDLDVAIKKLNSDKKNVIDAVNTNPNKTDIDAKTKTLNDSVAKVKEEILKVLNNLPNIDTDVKETIKTEINKESTNLDAKLKQLEKAKDIDKAFKDLKDTIELAKKTKTDNGLKDTNLTDIDTAINDAIDALERSKDNADALKTAKEALDRKIIDINVKQIEDNVTKVIDELKDANLDTVANDLKTKLDELKTKAPIAKEIKDIEADLTTIKNLIDLDKSKADAASTLNKISDKTNWTNDVISTDPSNNELNNIIDEVNNAKKELTNALDNPSTSKADIDSKSTALTNAVDKAKDKIKEIISGLTNIDPTVKNDIIAKIDDNNTDLTNKLNQLDKALKIDKAVKDLNDTIALAESTKTDNDLKDDNLANIINAINEAKEALNNSKEDSDALIKAKKDLDRKIIDINVKQIEDDAKKVIDELTNLGDNDKADALAKKVQDLKDKSSKATTINEIKTDINDLKSGTSLDKTKSNAAKLLNKINNKTNWSDNLAITDATNHNDLVTKINELNTAKNELITSLNTDNEQDIKDKIEELNKKLQVVNDQLDIDVNSKTNVPAILLNKFKEYIKDPTTNLSNALKALDKLNKLDMVDKDLNDQITKYQDLKTTNNINYDLSDKSKKDQFDNSISLAKDLRDYLKSNITTENENVVTDDTNFNNYIDKLNSAKDSIEAKWNDLEGNDKVDKATKTFIKSLENAFDTKKAIQDNGFDNNSDLDDLYTKLTNKDTNENLKTIGDLDDKSKFNDSNITLEINTVDKYDKLVNDSIKLDKRAKDASVAILDQEFNKVTNEKAKHNANGEYDLDKYKNTEFDTIKSKLDDLVTDKTNFDTSINDNTTNNVAIVEKAKEIKDKLIAIKLETSKAKANVAINALDQLSDTVKDNLKAQVAKAISDADIDSIVNHANDLNNLYKRLKDKIADYNIAINNDVLFKNSTKSLQTDVKDAYNEAISLVNNANDLLGTSLDDTDITTKLDDLTNAINALDGIDRLAKYKADAIAKLNTLSSLNNAQKTALENEITTSNFIDDIVGINQDITNANDGSILDKAIKLNNKMAELNAFLNPNDPNDKTNGISNSLKDHSDPSYKLASSEKQQAFDNAVLDATNLLDKDSGTNLDITNVDGVLASLKDAKTKLEDSSKRFIDGLINNIDNHLNDSLITDNDVKESLKNNIQKAILNTDTRDNATEAKSQAIGIINTVSFIDSKIKDLDKTVNKNPIFEDNRFNSIAKEIKDEIAKLKDNVDKIIDNWKQGSGSKLENDDIVKINLDSKVNIDLTAATATLADKKLNEKIDSINDLNLNATNKVVKSNIIFDYAKNKALKETLKDILNDEQLKSLNSLSIGDNIAKAIDLIKDNDQLLNNLKTKLGLNSTNTIDEVKAKLANSILDNNIFKTLVKSVLDITPEDPNTINETSANNIIDNNTDSEWIKELAKSLNLTDFNDKDAIKKEVKKVLGNTSVNMVGVEAKANLIKKLQEPGLKAKLNNRLTEIFNTESKEYASSLINKDNFKYLSDNEITNFINEIKDANIDLTANDQSLDYNIESIVKKAELLNLANKAKLAIKNVDNATKDLIETKINDLINEAFKSTNTKELVKNDPSDLFNTSKQKLINAELNLDKLNATTSNLINKINLANNAKTTVDYLNAKDYTSDPIVDSTNRINFDHSLANALAHTKDLVNENVDDQVNKPNNLVISIPNISDDNLFTAGGIENTNDNETKSINSELNDLSSDLVTKTNALDGEEILETARVNATNIINSLTNLSNKLKQELINQVNTVESNPLVDDIVNHAKELNDKYIELNNLLKLKDIIANTNHWINNTNAKDDQNLKDVIDQMINNVLDNNGLMPNHLGNIDNLTAINDNINQLRSLLNENNDNSNGLNGWNNTIAKSNEIIDSLFNTALDEDKVSNEDLTELNDGYKAILKDIIDSEITKAKALENELLDLKKQYASTTDVDAKAKLNQAINDKQNQINAIKDQYLNALTNARSKNRLKDLINQANHWLNNNTSSNQTVLRGNLPAIIDESLNHLLDLTNDNNASNDQFDKLQNALIDAKNRANRLHSNLDSINQLIKQAKDYIKNITPGSSLIDQLLNNIKQAQAVLNNDDGDVIDKANNKLANDLANIMLKNEVEKTTIVRDKLINNTKYQDLVDQLNNLIDQGNSLLDKVANTASVSKDLRDKQTNLAKEIAKNTARIALEKEAIDAKDWANKLSDSKYSSIKDNIIKAIDKALEDKDNKDLDQLIKAKDQLLNDLANSKLAKANVDANDLIKKLNQENPKYIKEINNLIKAIKDANNVDHNDTNKVNDSVKNLNKVINKTKAKQVINNAKEAIKDLIDSLVDKSTKVNLNNKTTDLINQINNVIHKDLIDEDQLNNLLDQTNKTIDQIKDAIAKAKLDDVINQIKDFINNKDTDNNTKEILKDKLNKALKNKDSITNNTKATNDLANSLIKDLAKAKLINQIKQAEKLINDINNNPRLKNVPRNIIDQILDRLYNDILDAKKVLDSDANTSLLDQTREKLANSTKAVKDSIDYLLNDWDKRINKAIEEIKKSKFLEDEIINKLTDQANKLYDDQDLKDLVKNTKSLDDHSGDLIATVLVAKDLANSNLFAKSTSDKQDALNDALSNIDDNQLLGNTNRGNSLDKDQVLEAIDRLNDAMNLFDGKDHKNYLWLIITSIVGTFTFVAGGIIAAIKRRKKKDK